MSHRSAFVVRHLVVACLALVPPAARAVVVDSFDVAPVAAGPGSFNQRQEPLDPAHVIGGMRRVNIVASDGAFAVDANAGTYHLQTNTFLEIASVAWGKVMTFDPELDVDLTAAGVNDRIRLSVLQSQAPTDGVNPYFRMTFSLTTHDGEGGLHYTSNVVHNIGNVSQPYWIDLPFSAFAAQIDPTDVDRLSMSFASNGPSSITLGGIFVVPEPALLSLLALPSMLLVRRRVTTRPRAHISCGPSC